MLLLPVADVGASAGYMHRVEIILSRIQKNDMLIKGTRDIRTCIVTIRRQGWTDTMGRDRDSYNVAARRRQISISVAPTKCTTIYLWVVAAS